MGGGSTRHTRYYFPSPIIALLLTLSGYRTVVSNYLPIEGDVTLKNRPKSFAWLALMAAACSFGIGIIFFRGWLYHQITLLSLPLFKQSQIPNPKSISTAANSLQQGKALKSPTAKDLIVSVPKQFQGKTISAAKLSGQDKVIALTFDDGPWPKNTEYVLNLLDQHKIKATFFWIGENVKNYPHIAQKVIAAGDVVGNHTWHHWYFRMDSAACAYEIDSTAAVIYKTTGVKTDLFRPPGGFLNNGLAEYAKKHNYLVTMWSDDGPEFNRHATWQTMVNDVLHGAKSGAIVLMHDGGGTHHMTMEALPYIIDGLTKRGYRFVTVPELLEIQAKEPAMTTTTKPAQTTNAVGSSKVTPLNHQ